jgi:parallel beta helix pectate lyase-like protein
MTPILSASIMFAYVALCFPTKLNATNTYYVDARTGSDMYDGTSPSSAWQSVKRLKSVVLAPGDTVLLERGSIWDQELIVTTSGTQLQPITIAAYGLGERPLLRGTRFDNSSASHNGVHVAGQSYIVIRDIAATHALYGFLFDAGANHNTVDSVEASFCRYDGIGFQDPGSVENKVINSISHDNGRSGVLFWNGANGGNLTGGSYYNNSAKYGSGAEFAESSDGVVSGVTTYNNFYGLKAYGDQTSNIMLTNNTVYLNVSFGIDVDGTGTNVIVQENTVYANGSHGIAVEGATKASIIRYNVVHHNGGTNQAGIMLDGTTDVQVYYNLVYNEAIGVWAFGAQSAGIYNNTTFNSDACFALENAAIKITLKNNISSKCTDSDLYLARGSERGVVSDYNNWDSTGTSSIVKWGGKDYGLPAWQQITGLDVHSMSFDPQFVDPSNGDFRVRSTSLAIQAGTDTGLGITRDLADVTLPLDVPVDLGAFQGGGVQ